VIVIESHAQLKRNAKMHDTVLAGDRIRVARVIGLSKPGQHGISCSMPLNVSSCSMMRKRSGREHGVNDGGKTRQRTSA
jgi:hypothetical protein